MIEELQLTGMWVLLDIPYEARYRKGIKGGDDIELPSLEVKNKWLKVVKTGLDVPSETLQEGDEIVFLSGDQVVIQSVFGVEYIIIQFFDIQGRKKRPEQRYVSSKGFSQKITPEGIIELTNGSL